MGHIGTEKAAGGYIEQRVSFRISKRVAIVRRHAPIRIQEPSGALQTCLACRGARTIGPRILVAPKGFEAHPSALVQMTNVVLVSRKNYGFQRNAVIGCSGKCRLQIGTKGSKTPLGLQALVMRKRMSGDLLFRVRSYLIDKAAAEMERIIVFIVPQDLHIQIG